MFVYALSSSQDNGWHSGKVIGPLVSSLLLMAFFGFHETRVRTPLVPVDLLFDLSFSLNLAASVLTYAVRQACTFSLALQLQYDGSSPLSAGVKFLPMATVALLFNSLSNWIVPALGPRLMVGACESFLDIC